MYILVFRCFFLPLNAVFYLISHKKVVFPPSEPIPLKPMFCNPKLLFL